MILTPRELDVLLASLTGRQNRLTSRIAREVDRHNWSLVERYMALAEETDALRQSLASLVKED